MKMKTIEDIRKVELVGALGISVLATLSRMDNDSLTFLIQNADFINLLNSIFNYTYTLDILTNQKTQKLTSDYKELDVLYQEAIKNISKFYEMLELNDPLSICGVYQYMYRKGYLSRNNYFEYSSNMKDLADLYGIDVIRGSGVCRSISSMLVDIYKKLGYESHGLAVRVEDGMLKEVNPNSYVPMNKNSNSKRLVKFAIGISSIFHIANHVITEVSTDSGKLLLCPTNCLVLQKEKNKITVANQPTSKVMYFNPIADMLTGIKSNPVTSFKEMNTVYTAPEEHQEIMKSIARDCEFNKDLFEEFYQQNHELFEEIGAKADEQHGLVKRIIPILPLK